jgi:hypothetical protein
MRVRVAWEGPGEKSSKILTQFPKFMIFGEERENVIIVDKFFVYFENISYVTPLREINSIMSHQICFPVVQLHDVANTTKRTI